MRVERRKIDLNHKNRMIKLWIAIIGTVVILISSITTGAIRMNQIEINKEDIESIEDVQKEDHDAITEIRTTVKDMKEQLNRIEDKL